MKARWLLTLVFGVLSSAPFTNAWADMDIVAMALFENKAVLQVDGKQRMLAVGETSPEGVKLLRVDGDVVVIELNGKRETIALGSHSTASIAAPQVLLVTLAPDQNGMFRTSGSVNGQSMRFIVDTGATLVAMNSAEAKRLGIDFRMVGKKSQVETASGMAAAFYLTLRTVKIGEIEVRDVDAVVLDGSFPTVTLLGMSFLSRIDVEHTGGTLRLKKKY